MFKIKRPALWAFIVAMAAAITAHLCSLTAVCVFAAVLVTAAARAAVKNKAVAVVALLLGVAVLMHAAIIQVCALDKLAPLNAKNVEICGTLCDTRTANQTHIKQTVAVSSIDGHSFAVPVKILLINSNGFAAPQGDKICITAKLKISENTAYQKSNFAQGIYATCTNIKVKSITKGKNIYSLSGRVKQYVNKTLERYLSYNQASVLSGIVIGDNLNIDDAFYNNVVDSGVSHMLVVSGMHLTIICSAFINLLRKIMSRRMAAVFLLPLVLFIALVCDFGYSILRAAMGYIIFLVSNMLLKKPDPISSLCMACVFILISNPFALGSVSLWLSVSATWGIISISAPLSEHIENKYGSHRLYGLFKIIAEPFCTTLGAMVFCLPVSMLVFGRVSLVSLLTNLLVSYSITIALCAAILGLVISVVIPFEPLLNIVFAIPGICIKYFTVVVNFAASIPYACVEVTKVYAIVFTVLLAVGTVFAYNCIIKGKKRRLLRVLAIALIPLCIVTAYLNTGRATVTAVALSKSQSIIISCHGYTAVIGTGGSAADGKRINAALQKEKITQIDALYILDENANFAGTSTVIDANNIGCVYTAQDDDIKAKIKQSGNKVHAVSQKQNPIDNITLTFLDGAVNIDFDGYTVFVYGTGDALPIHNLYAKKADAVILSADGQTAVCKRHTASTTSFGSVSLKIKQGFALS